MEDEDIFKSLDCSDPLCCNATHHQYIDTATRRLLFGMVDSAWSNLESTQGTTGDQSSRRYTIPGWNEKVKPFQGEARFWLSLWLSAGKPIHSAVPGVDQICISG